MTITLAVGAASVGLIGIPIGIISAVRARELLGPGFPWSSPP